jgi:hypothetical protein
VRTGFVGRLGVVGRPGWHWGFPLVAGAAATSYYYDYPSSSCLAWNGFTWVNNCYSWYHPYGYHVVP